MGLIKKTILVLCVSAILLLALAMGGIRLVISNIEYFRPEISYLLERDVSKGIVFNRIGGSMNRFNPVLLIENVSLNLPDRSQPLFIDRIEVEFDFWASLRERAPVALRISGKLEKVELSKDTSGHWWLNEYEIGAGDAVLPVFSQFLAFLPRYLKLDLNRLIVRDEENGQTHQLQRVAARIIHRQGRFFTQVSAALPDEFGRGLLLKSIVDSNSSLVYANGSDLQLSPLAQLFGVDTRGLKNGALDGEIWVDMSGFRVTGIRGDLVLKRGVLQVAPDKAALTIDYHGRFKVNPGESGWRISNRFDRLAIDGKKVPGFQAQVNIPGGATGDRVAAWIDRLPVSSLPVIAGQWLPNTLGNQIAQGRLQGLLRDVVFEMDFAEPELFRLAARVVGLGSQQFDYFPGVDKLDADFVIGNNKLAANVHGEGVSVDFGDLFRAPIRADSLRMKLNLTRQESGNLLLAANEIELRNRDVSAAGRLQLETDGDNPPFMYLRAAFEDAKAGSSSKYIPIHKLPAKTVEWLDRGIISGFAPAGDLQFHGRLRKIRQLARDRAGEFFVDFTVQNADIFFAPGWQHARNANGKVLFHNAGVEFDIEQASYGHIDDIKAHGTIADFAQASLDLAITTEAPTGDALQVFGSTPVGSRYRDVFANLQDFGGVVGGAIDLRLPLGKNVHDRKVNVEVSFKDAAVKAPNWGVEVSQITGRLHVSENDVAASNMSARFFGDPVRIDIASENPAMNTLASIEGNFESANLLRRLPRYLASNVIGNSDWKLRLNVAGDAAPADRPLLRINATSNLRHTQIALPLPFRKQAQETKRFTADVDIYPRKIRFASSLGDHLLGRGTLREGGKGGFRLDALDIAFADALHVQQRVGINLYGKLEQLSIDDWLEVLGTAGKTETEALQSVDLGVAHLQAFGRDIDTVKFELRQTDGRFRGLIDASVARGSFESPPVPSAADPLSVDLDYLVIGKPGQQDSPGQLKPSGLPALRLASKSLRYHDMSFNDLFIDMHPQGETLKVTTFKLRRDALLLNGSAHWDYDPVKLSSLSSLRLSIRGSGLGEAVDGLGFGNSMSKGTIDFSGNFAWPAAPAAFDLAILSGDAKLKVTDGRLNNVEPGSGRFVGLLSLTALPRRLSLDFSDVLIDGMEFDKITGSYSIADGVLSTGDTSMDGPAAKIKISGKTGIIRRDYDQYIRVTPKIRQTLPLLGAVSAGTTVGWGLLLLQNVFKKAIDDAVEIEYHVTGSWDDPQIELLKAIDENQQELPKIDK